MKIGFEKLSVCVGLFVIFCFKISRVRVACAEQEMFQNLPVLRPATGGQVYCLTETAQDVYIAGSFDSFGNGVFHYQIERLGVTITVDTDGRIDKAVPDARGGYWILGDFSKAASVPS